MELFLVFFFFARCGSRAGLDIQLHAEDIQEDHCRFVNTDGVVRLAIMRCDLF